MKRGASSRPVTPGGGTHPDAGKPLSAFRRITVVCNDCGDATVLEEAQLAELSAVPTFAALWSHAFCRACRDSGATGPANVDLHGEKFGVAAAAGTPNWSEKPVFGDDRSDPFPALPRRPIFDR